MDKVIFRAETAMFNYTSNTSEEHTSELIVALTELLKATKSKRDKELHKKICSNKYPY